MIRTNRVEIPQTLDEACDASRTALIVDDMQVGILRQLKDGAGVVAKVVQVLRATREARIPVFFTRHLSLPKDLMGAFQLRTAMAWQRVGTVEEVRPWFRDSPAFQLVPEVAPLPSEAIFDKIGMSAFEGTPLDVAMRDCGLSTFLIAGVAMEIGIEPTVRHGADLAYIPIVVTDACGAGHPEAADRALASMRFMGDAMFATTEEICATLLRRR